MINITTTTTEVDESVVVQRSYSVPAPELSSSASASHSHNNNNSIDGEDTEKTNGVIARARSLNGLGDDGRGKQPQEGKGLLDKLKENQLINIMLGMPNHTTEPTERGQPTVQKPRPHTVS